jgi:hypothetical protein
MERTPSDTRKRDKANTMNIPTGTETISTSKAAEVIRNARGMVSVYVQKRKDGSMRRMNGFAACNLSDDERAKVTNGQGMAFDPIAHDLIPFYEMVSEVTNGTRTVKGKTIQGKIRQTVGKQFRNVSIEGIRCVRANGTTYNVKD